MDNITHAFAGAAIAECALPPAASPALRRVFLVAGVIAATAPDFDLVYTSITEAPLGYLLHHRGHTHTWPGLLALGGLLAAALRFWPAAREAMAAERGRLFLALAAALVSHLLMDAANSYGTHLLYPFSTAWYYGDAVFILEPWAWILLGTLLALNARGRIWRWVTLLFALGPPLGLALVGLVPPGAAAALFLGAAALALLARPWQPRRRAAIALAATVALFFTLAILSRTAAGEARRQLQAAGSGEIVDLVMDANPAVPWCWSLLAIERQGEQLISRRGSLSLLESTFPATGCAMYRLAAQGIAAGGMAAPSPASTGELHWLQEWRTDLAQLRQRNRDDCRTAAWLQFVRAPHLEEHRAADLRYENPMRDNFSALELRLPSPDCPKNLTRWEQPRRDLLEPRGP